MKMNHFLSIADYSEPELMHILDVSKQLKAELKAGGNQPILAGKTLALVFQKASLRTRVSFEIGMHQLGGYAFYLSPDEIGLGKREAVKDVAQVLGGYVDAIMARFLISAVVYTAAGNDHHVCILSDKEIIIYQIRESRFAYYNRYMDALMLRTRRYDDIYSRLVFLGHYVYICSSIPPLKFSVCAYVVCSFRSPMYIRYLRKEILFYPVHILYHPFFILYRAVYGPI